MKTNKELLNNAITMRKEMTRQEKMIWFQYCKLSKMHWYRQRVVGPYILDFYCKKANLALEIDGSQHYDKEGLEYDQRRTKYLEKQGIYVHRITNLDVDRNFEAVCLEIKLIVEKRLEDLSVTS